MRYTEEEQRAAATAYNEGIASGAFEVKVGTTMRNGDEWDLAVAAALLDVAFPMHTRRILQPIIELLEDSGRYVASDGIQSYKALDRGKVLAVVARELALASVDLEDQGPVLKNCSPPGCSCRGHSVPGVHHVVACCDEPHVDNYG